MPDPEVDLARAALLIAKEEYAQLPVDRYMARLDILAEEVKNRLDDETAPLVVLNLLLSTLYGVHGFQGNKDAYYDPRNSFLNDVLDRGLGIPLSLGIVLLEVGWRLDLPLEGVNFPGHFLVRYRGDAVDLLIDPFDGGRIRFEDEAQELLDRVYGGMVRIQSSFLRRACKKDMLSRLLANLKSVYSNVEDDARTLAVIERILLLRPKTPHELRDRGKILARMGRVDDAIDELESYLEFAPRATDAQRIRNLLRDLKRQDGRVHGKGHEDGKGHQEGDARAEGSGVERDEP